MVLRRREVRRGGGDAIGAVVGVGGDVRGRRVVILTLGPFLLLRRRRRPGRLLRFLLGLGLGGLLLGLGGLLLSLGVLLSLPERFFGRLQRRLELLHLSPQLRDLVLLVLHRRRQLPLLLPLGVDGLRVRLHLGRLLRRRELLHRVELAFHRRQELLDGDDPLAAIRRLPLSLPLIVHRRLDLVLEALRFGLRRLELTRERERLRLLLVQLSLQARDWFFGLLLGSFPPLSHLRVHVRALRLEQLLLLLELTHQLALQHEEIVLLLLELLVLGEPGVVRLFLQALHLFLVVRLELGDAGLLPSDLRLALGDQALLLLQGVIGLLRVGPVRDDGGVQSLQLRVPVLEELEVVPEILRELRELLLGLGELLLADRELLLDVLRALVDLVHALLGERDELLWSLFEGAHLGGQRSALRGAVGLSSFGASVGCAPSPSAR